MLYSMTGYGRSQKTEKDKSISVDIKSINSKTFDLRVKVPMAFQSKEIEIRRILSQELIRGKIDFNLQVSGEEGSDFIIDSHAFKTYFEQITKLATDLRIPQNDILNTITRLPGVIVPSEESNDEMLWKTILMSIKEALLNFNEFRMTEGSVLYEDMKKRVEKINQSILEIIPLEENRIEKIKTRLQENQEFFLPHIVMDKNRFEQELLYYLDKLDITEEKTRLSQHCKYFIETCLDKKEGMDKGKKLNFIIQEMGREINTLGSKANDADIQKIVVTMKDEADKIKEQLANIL
jgi:uncharacterized protein (TIGR00255 family)